MSMCSSVWSQHCSRIYLYIWTGVLLHSCGLLMLSTVKSCNTNSQKSCNTNTQKSCYANEYSENFKQIAQIAQKAPCHVFFLSTRKVLLQLLLFLGQTSDILKPQLSLQPALQVMLSVVLLHSPLLPGKLQDITSPFSKQKKKGKTQKTKPSFHFGTQTQFLKTTDCSSDFVKQTKT